MQVKAKKVVLVSLRKGLVAGPWCRWMVLGMAGCCLGWAGLARAEVKFTPVVVQKTPAPGGGIFYHDFGQSPAIDGTNVVFTAERQLRTIPKGGPFGVYRWDGHSFFTVVDGDTPLPGMSEIPETNSYDSVAISGTEVAFSMRYMRNGAGHLGLFATYDGELKQLATETTPLPGFKEQRAAFGAVYRSGQNVAFTAGAWGKMPDEAQGVYLSKAGGPPTVAADLNTTMPGTTKKFTAFYTSIGLAGENVAFIGKNDTSAGGVYLSEAGQLSVIADKTTKLPNGSFVLGRMGEITNEELSYDGKNIAFGDDYIRARIEGQFQTVVAQRSDPTRALFPYLDQTISIDGNTVVFGVEYVGGVGMPDQLDGIYMWRDGVISKVIDTSDTLDGKHPKYLRFGPDCISGDNIVFYARFENWDQGIYMATVPEPGVLMSLLIAAAPMMLARKRLRN